MIIRRHPAEWEKQSAVWLAWPHNEKEWGKNNLAKVKNFYQKLIPTLLDFENVNLILKDESQLDEVQKFIPENGKRNKCRKIVIPNNDIWIRDYGPFFLETFSKKTKKTTVLDFEFNGWGKKFSPWDLDNKVPKEIALYLGEEVESYPLVLEGGALDFSSEGLAITTKECLLNKNRNPNTSMQKMEAILKAAFNLEEIIWLEHGLKNDHTDGHVDNIARFIGPKKVLGLRTYSIKDDNFECLFENVKFLKSWRHPKKGYKLEVVEIPSPEELNGKLPYSYLNFIFVNGGVIVPTFNSKTDTLALKIFKLLFPDREVAGIDCSLVVEEGGSLHCITKQEPLI